VAGEVDRFHVFHEKQFSNLDGISAESIQRSPDPNTGKY
jgi:hypothetical protein